MTFDLTASLHNSHRRDQAVIEMAIMNVLHQQVHPDLSANQANNPLQLVLLPRTCPFPPTIVGVVEADLLSAHPQDRVVHRVHQVDDLKARQENSPVHPCVVVAV